MTGIEVQTVTPEEMGRELEGVLRTHQENKYAFQVGLKDLDFDINNDLIRSIGLSLPFQSIDQAEQALRTRVIAPTLFIEYDSTEHQVLIFDPRPIGFSGFMNCVTHSLALTSQGLFEVGRYPAINMSTPNRSWQWFLHRRFATADEINDLQESQSLIPGQFMEDVYQAYIYS